MKQSKQEYIEINNIRTDGGINYAHKLTQDLIESLVQAIEHGYELPPVICFYDGEDYWLADGLDILEVAKLADKKTVLADIRQAQLEHAIYSVDSHKHPLRHHYRTNQEKRQLVTQFLQVLKQMDKKQQKKWSQSQIGRFCGVRHDYVGTIMGEIGYKKLDILDITRGKTTYSMKNFLSSKKSNSTTKGFNWDKINYEQFEEIVYELVKAGNPYKIEWRTGTGGKGRDIEAKFIERDSLGNNREAIYFIEAKHHKSGIAPKDISGALAWAHAQQPTSLIIAVSSHLTNACREYKKSWEQNNKKVAVTIWERKDIEEKIMNNESIKEIAVRWGIVPKSIL